MLSESDGDETEDSGFLINQVTLDELQSLLKQDSEIAVATDDDESIAAFLLYSPGQVYVRRHPETDVSWDDGGDIRPRFESGDFCYLDQIGVDRSYERLGLATRLIEFVTGLRPAGERILAAIIREPVMNRASHALFEHEGFAKVGIIAASSGTKYSLVAR